MGHRQSIVYGFSSPSPVPNALHVHREIFPFSTLALMHLLFPRAELKRCCQNLVVFLLKKKDDREKSNGSSTLSDTMRTKMMKDLILIFDPQDKTFHAIKPYTHIVCC